MTISFIVTTYNIRSYIDRCLTSLAEVARAGDEVILVDDGSDDGTTDLVRDIARAAPFAEGVNFRPIYLGTNTMGGVGIGANIGLGEAGRDTIFFVDGDDWIDTAGFQRARAHWAMHPTDILVANYLEYDQAADLPRKPADARRWGAAANDLSPDAARALALSMIAVPWRKFYRRAFLEQHGLRFPEGDFFFEDNPFHWAVCLRAASIGFVDAVICHHRINRPGQTMASTGAELAAFFTHFETIVAGLDAGDADHRLAACQWLVNNMTWHMARLSPPARHGYASRAARALGGLPDDLWQRLAETEGQKAIWPVVDRLRRGDVDAQMLQWQSRALEKAVEALQGRIDRLEKQAAETAAGLRGQTAAAAFESIVRSRQG